MLSETFAKLVRKPTEAMCCHENHHLIDLPNLLPPHEEEFEF